MRGGTLHVAGAVSNVETVAVGPAGTLSLAGALAKAQLWENTLGFKLLLRLPALVAEMVALALVLRWRSRWDRVLLVVDQFELIEVFE